MSLVPAVPTTDQAVFQKIIKNIYASIKRTLSSEAFLLQARRSGRDFTRERALPLQRLVPLLLNFRKGTNRDELDQFSKPSRMIQHPLPLYPKRPSAAPGKSSSPRHWSH